MTLLGLAVFNLSIVEQRLLSVSETEAQAYQIAQAGLERVVFGTQDGNTLTKRITDNLNGSWAGAALFPGNYFFYNIGIANLLADLGGGFGGGSYLVGYREVPITEANQTHGLPCIQSTDEPTNCANLLSVRVIGAVRPGAVTGGSTPEGVRAANPPGYVNPACESLHPNPLVLRNTVCRMIQVLVRADSTSPFAAAVTSATPGFPASGTTPMRGLIAGSITFLGCNALTPASVCDPADMKPFNLDQPSSGQRNHYANLTGRLLNHIQAQLNLVCTTTCPSTTTAESLGATFRIAAPPPGSGAAIILRQVSLGESANTGTYSNPGTAGVTRSGKGRLDAIYVADGCTGSCTSHYDLGSGGTAGSIFVQDNLNCTSPGCGLTRPYPDRNKGGRAARSFPLLRDPAILGPGSITSCTTASGCYDHYACPEGGCLGTEFYTTNVPGAGGLGATDHDLLTPRVGSTETRNLRQIFSSGDLGGGAWQIDFPYTNASGVLMRGSVCWDPSTSLLQFAAVLFPGTAAAGCGDSTQWTSTGSATNGPALLYLRTNVTLSSPSSLEFQGSAIILVAGTTGSNGDATVDASIQNRCVDSSSNPVNDNTFGVCARLFPRDDMIAFLATQDARVGPGSNRTVMGFFYSQRNFLVDGNNAVIIGSVAASRLCFASGCGGSGDAQLFQATLQRYPLELIPGPGRHWSISFVPNTWTECKTLPLHNEQIPTGAPPAPARCT